MDETVEILNLNTSEANQFRFLIEKLKQKPNKDPYGFFEVETVYVCHIFIIYILYNKYLKFYLSVYVILKNGKQWILFLII